MLARARAVFFHGALCSSLACVSVQAKMTLNAFDVPRADLIALCVLRFLLWYW